MDSQQPKRSSSAFEYFLYAAMVAETGLAAVIYKVIFGSSEMVACAFTSRSSTLRSWPGPLRSSHRLHRERASKPEIPDQEPAPEPREDTRPACSALLDSQLAILVVVFATAVATFSWALRVLR